MRAVQERLKTMAAGEDSSGDGATLEELQEAKAALRAEMAAAEESLEDKRAAVDSGSEELERLRTAAGRLREECLGLEKLNADKVHLAGEAAKLEADGERLEAEVAKEDGRFLPLREAILALEKERGELREKRETALEAERRRGVELRTWIQNLERPLSTVRNYTESGKEMKLNQLLRRIEEAEAAQKVCWESRVGNVHYSMV